jgi:hypothetical protein
MQVSGLRYQVRVMKRVLVLFVSLLLCASAVGDVIHLTDGRKITGKVVREETDQIVVKTRYGQMTIDRFDIDRIEKGSLPEEIYEEKAKALADDDAQGHYELGLWCKDNDLGKEAKGEFEKAIAARSRS